MSTHLYRNPLAPPLLMLRFAFLNLVQDQDFGTWPFLPPSSPELLDCFLS